MMARASLQIQPAAGEIVVCGLSQARKHKRLFDAVLTLEDPEARSAIQLRFHKHPSPDHLILNFEDVDDDTLGIRVATRNQIESSLDFGRKHRTGALLVHCFRGVGRSAGVALAILADRLGPRNEKVALTQLLAGRPEAIPNSVVVKLADGLLGREGKLIQAVQDWEGVTPGIKEWRKTRYEFVRSNAHLYSWL